MIAAEKTKLYKNIIYRIYICELARLPNASLKWEVRSYIGGCCHPFKEVVKLARTSQYWNRENLPILFSRSSVKKCGFKFNHMRYWRACERSIRRQQ